MLYDTRIDALARHRIALRSFVALNTHLCSRRRRRRRCAMGGIAQASRCTCEFLQLFPHMTGRSMRMMELVLTPFAWVHCRTSAWSPITIHASRSRACPNSSICPSPRPSHLSQRSSPLARSTPRSTDRPVSSTLRLEGPTRTC